MAISADYISNFAALHWYEWKILEFDETPQTNKQKKPTNQQTN